MFFFWEIVLVFIVQIVAGFVETFTTENSSFRHNSWQLADMRYYADAADAADAVNIKNIKLCVKFMLEFKSLTRNVTILCENRNLIHPCW
jgi:hypothetical protein